MYIIIFEIDRFARPTYAQRSRLTTTSTPISIEEETATKSKTNLLSVASPAPLSSRGRSYYYCYLHYFVQAYVFLYLLIFYYSSFGSTTYKARNRLNVKSTPTPSSASTEEKISDENTIDASFKISSPPQRTTRVRPNFNLRGRQRSTVPSTSTPPGLVDESSGQKSEETDEKPSTPVPSNKSSSRFNLRRPNQLLIPRGRLVPSTKSSSSNVNADIANNSNTPSDNEKAPINTSLFEANKESSKFIIKTAIKMTVVRDLKSIVYVITTRFEEYWTLVYTLLNLY